ncbi:MAG: NAD(P)-binding domain-containing protein [Nannocystaceae bacterium]|nr:NAD(P)-binding domain-containing protein [Nannocystaceae bacterium]
MAKVQEIDYLILGAGPAGLQLAYFLERAGRNYVVLDGADHVGAFFSRYPRHRTLLSINKSVTGRDDPEFNLRHDWNSLICDDPSLRITQMTDDYLPSADVLVDYLARFAKAYDLNVRLKHRVGKIQREHDGRFAVECESGTCYSARSVVVATGVGKPLRPDIPGIELAQPYETMSVDPEAYRGQNVLILGKGNSAFETADNLIPTTAVIHMLSPHPVTLAWDSRFVGHVRAVNNNFLDTYHLKSQNGIIDGHVREMVKTEAGKVRVSFSSIHARNEVEQIEYDTVLCCTGFRFDSAIFDRSCAPEVSDCGRLPKMSMGFESPNVPGLFFAGALTQFLDHKKAQSAFIHGFRYNAQALAGLLARRYHDTPLPSESVEAKPQALAQAVLERMNRVSSLWQQVGFLADMLVLPEKSGEPARYVFGLPYDYLVEHGPELSRGQDFYICMFRLGENPPNAHDYDRSTDLYDGASSTNIHPVLEHRCGQRGTLRSEFHVLEDFLADWSGREYLGPCAEYFERSMQGDDLQAKAPPQQRTIVRDANMRLVDAELEGSK